MVQPDSKVDVEMGYSGKGIGDSLTVHVPRGTFTGFAPFELLHGRSVGGHIWTLLETIKEEWRGRGISYILAVQERVVSQLVQ